MSTQDKLPNQSIYRFYAPFYDLLFGWMYASPRKQAARMLELKAGESLLISGVGTGLDLPLIPAGVDVTGVDISADMLAQARAKSAGRQAICLMQMDAQALTLPSLSFDAVLLSLIVSVAPNGQKVFQEAWRVLKPGGRLVLFDKFAPENPHLSPVRRVVGSVIRLLGTDVNRRLSDMITGADGLTMEVQEPSLFGGQYQILRFRKL